MKNYEELNQKLLPAAQNGNKDAKADIIANNMGLAGDLAKEYLYIYAKKHYESADFWQTARMAMLKAIKNYNKNRGCSFSTYAYNYMKYEILHELNPGQTDYHCDPYVVSLDEVVDDEESISRHEMVADPDVDVEAEVVHGQMKVAARNALDELLTGERQFINERLGLNGCKKESIEVLARKYKTNPKGVREAEKLILGKLAKKIA